MSEKHTERNNDDTGESEQRNDPAQLERPRLVLEFDAVCAFGQDDGAKKMISSENLRFIAVQERFPTRIK